MVAIGLGLGVAFVRAWLVPGWAYRELQALVKILTDQGDRNSQALEKQAASFDRLRRDFEAYRKKAGHDA